MPPGNSAAAAPLPQPNLVATAKSFRKSELAWTDKSCMESGFEIYDKVGSTGALTLVAATGVGAQTCTRSSLTAARVYTYEVRAIRDPGPVASAVAKY